MKGEEERKRKAILAELQLLEKIRKEHEWIAIGQKEAEEEEEESASEVVEKLKLVGDAADGLFMLDNELGQRVFTPPASEQG